MTRRLPFANAATIVRAHQKDAYFESQYRSQLLEVLQFLKGQRFINTYPQEITVFAKLVYLALTVLIGARTLGEEYVDLIYVNRSGKKLPRVWAKLGFIVSYAVVPYLVSKLVKRYRLKEGDETDGIGKFLSHYHNVLDTLMNVHIALFYFQGEFYSLSKRLFGLRYAFGHNKDPEKMKNAGNYSLLGGIILVQFVVKGLIKLKTYNDEKTKKAPESTQVADASVISTIDQLQGLVPTSIDLSDPKQLPYIPEGSRTCMLCLSAMVDPSASMCGHMFCWECIVDWLREHPECPLCRQGCVEQNLLTLR